MKTEKEADADISLYVKSIVGPIFDKFAQETPKNHMMGGGAWIEKKGLALYSPHNYRLYIDFSRENFKPKTVYKPTVKSVGVVTHKLLNHGHEHKFENFMGCDIRIKKSQAEVINHIDPKRTYTIEISETAESQVVGIIRQKDDECLAAFRSFIQVFGGRSNFTILKRVSEDKVWGTDSINSIPIKERFHNHVVKKVYNERNVEYSDPVFVVNHLVNSGVVEVAPSLCRSIEMLAFNINPLRTLKSLIKGPEDIMKYRDLVIRLNNKERQELSEWLFRTQ